MTIVNIPVAGAAITAWAPSTAYAVGAYVTEDNTLYQAPTGGVAASTTFNPASWTTVVEGVAGFAPNTVVQAGDPVIQGGILYYANSTFTTGSTFSASNWTAAAGAPLAVSTKTATYTVVASDRVLLCDATSAAFTVTLAAPSAFVARLDLAAITTGANLVTVTTPSGLIIPPGAAGSESTTLGTQASGAPYEAITVVSDGTNYRVI